MGLLGMDSDERMLSRAFTFASYTIPDGDYLEFGVWKGRSFVKAFHMWKAQHWRKGRMQRARFFAFDSFKGLPEPVDAVDRSTGEFKKGDYTFSQEAFEHVLRAKKVSRDRVCIVPGWFDESLTHAVKKEQNLQQVAIAWIDCDLYASAVPVLEFLTDLIKDTAVIIFDDWYCFGGRPDRGEQKAFAEWLARHPELRAQSWYSPSWKAQSFIVYRQ